MSDPRNVAHDKKVAHEKKHNAGETPQGDAAAVQPGKKPAAPKPDGDAGADNAPVAAGAGESAPPENPAPTPAVLSGALVVLAKLKELEFHSRAHLERMAELSMTVEDDLKQKPIVAPLGEVYSAQNNVQTKLTALIEQYQAECDRLQAENA